MKTGLENMLFYFTDKNRLFRGYISVHTLSLILGCCTFDSDYSSKASWERSYKLGTLVSGHICPFLLAYPCKLHQGGWGVSVHSHFSSFHRCSIGFRSGLWLGHSRTCTDFLWSQILRHILCIAIANKYCNMIYRPYHTALLPNSFKHRLTDNMTHCCSEEEEIQGQVKLQFANGIAVRTASTAFHAHGLLTSAGVIDIRRTSNLYIGVVQFIVFSA